MNGNVLNKRNLELLFAACKSKAGLNQGDLEHFCGLLEILAQIQ